MARSAIHAGEHLADAISAAGLTATQLARDSEVSPDRITGIPHFTRGITADAALRLGRSFGISAAFWDLASEGFCQAGPLPVASSDDAGSSTPS